MMYKQYRNLNQKISKLFQPLLLWNQHRSSPWLTLRLWWQNQHRILSLRIGLMRLHGWQRKLRRLLKALKLEQETANPQLGSFLLPKELVNLHPRLRVHRENFLWTQQVLEDLYLMLESLRLSLEYQLSLLKSRRG